MTRPSTTPVRSTMHGGPPGRGLADTPSSSTQTGRFGRMFRNLPAFDIPDATLVHLGQAMVQPLEDGVLDKPLGVEDDDENTSTLDGSLRLPAGYTYFGQFVDHDITFDPVSSLVRQNDPDALENFRTPRFDLDNLYGRGPADQPYLYEPDGLHLLSGEPVAGPPDVPDIHGPDLPRNKNNRALIGDPRNDENLIISQLQATFIGAHNAVVDQVRAEHPGWSDSDVFKLAQRTVRWHYQWVVVHDFLPRLVGAGVVEDILPAEDYDAPGPNGDPVVVTRPVPRLKFYKFKQDPFMPVEFAVAAYRFGHTMVRPSYLINDIAFAQPALDGAARIPLFAQSDEPLASLNGFRALPDFWGFQWKFFLDHVDGSGVPNLPQPSYKLDSFLSHPLGAMPASAAAPEVLVPGFNASIAQGLAIRNLLRGKQMGLPSGPDVARAMGIEPLGPGQLLDGERFDEVRAKLAGREPLWFYILREAEICTQGSHLGPVGGRIVAEVLIGLLAADPLSFLRVQPTWTPTLPSVVPDRFSLSDIVNLAHPIGA